MTEEDKKKARSMFEELMSRGYKPLGIISYDEKKTDSFSVAYLTCQTAEQRDEAKRTFIDILEQDFVTVHVNVRPQ